MCRRARTIFCVATTFALACWARGQTFTVVYAFQGQPDGTNPFAAVTLDAAGNLYGTAETGGAGCPNGGCGAVFKISKSGTEKLLYSFTGAVNNDQNPAAG